MFGWWYPYPYRELSGGRELFTLVVAVDVVLGPLITLVIFNAAKTRRHLLMDFSVIGLLQVAALAYGLWTVFVARPVHLVFEYNRMAVVHAVDIEPSTLTQAPPGFQQLPVGGPTLLSLRPLLRDGKLRWLRSYGFDISHAGTMMRAPDNSVNTAMIAAVIAPNVTSGIEPS